MHSFYNLYRLFHFTRSFSDYKWFRKRVRRNGICKVIPLIIFRFLYKMAFNRIVPDIDDICPSLFISFFYRASKIFNENFSFLI